LAYNFPTKGKGNRQAEKRVSLKRGPANRTRQRNHLLRSTKLSKRKKIRGKEGFNKQRGRRGKYSPVNPLGRKWGTAEMQVDKRGWGDKGGSLCSKKAKGRRKEKVGNAKRGKGAQGGAEAGVGDSVHRRNKHEEQFKSILRLQRGNNTYDSRKERREKTSTQKKGKRDGA